jgi:putative PEP-CTERM system histidine kinase
MQIGVLSYGLAAIAFGALTALLMSSWRGRVQGALLAASSAFTALWAAAAAFQIFAGRPPYVLVDVLEVLRDGAWLAFLILLLGAARRASPAFTRTLRFITAALGVFCLVVIAILLLRQPSVFEEFSGASYFADILGRVILSVAGIVTVEQLYRNVLPQQRWGVKFLCLGAGGLFAYDFYLYSDAMLFKRLDVAIWDARGIINAFAVPLVAVSAARNPDWSLDVTVSRRVLFHSATLFGAGVYLLGMAAAGYYIRFVGGQWGAVFQVTFLFGALILLMIVLFSGTVRARLKVFLSKHFFSYRYDYREEWLRFTHTLSEGEPGVQLRERSIQAIAQLVESPAGALWLRQDSEEFQRAAHWNLPDGRGTLSVGSPLAQFLEHRQWVIDLDELEAYPERYDDLTPPELLHAIPRIWLVVPLILHENLLGFVILARSRGQITLNWEVSDLLKTAGRQVASYLAQLEAANALLVARQFDSFNRMSAFVVHDLKNLVSQLSLLLSNAQKHKHNPEFQDDMLQTVGHSVEKMKRLLLQLRSGNPIPEKPMALALVEVLKQAIAGQDGSPIKPKLVADGIAPLVVANRERLTRVLGHLVKNAIEATPAQGQVSVRVASMGKFAIIEVADTGRGMTEQFIRDKLFRPFESTKETGMGVGTYECQQYVQELGGRIEVSSIESKGSTFRVYLPQSSEEAQQSLPERGVA